VNATAEAGANIALLKYWGVRDKALNLPLNGSISITLNNARTVTSVHFDASLPEDQLELDGRPASEGARRRAERHLDILRQLTGVTLHARIISRNNFPTGAGIASSASGFAALTVAAAAALGLDRSPRELSRLARRGSGSACRSLFGGFVEWVAGVDDATSFSRPLAPPEHWALEDLIAVVAEGHKAVSSAEGHRLATTSPLCAARVRDVERALPLVRAAIRRRDLRSLGEIVERDAIAMHAVMMTSQPPLFYWLPETLRVVLAVRTWREEGSPAYFTIDAGPNVHVLCEAGVADEVEQRLKATPGVRRVLRNRPGPAPRLLPAMR
jgi:diphosphomevalonate decarboxylase